MVEAKSLQLCSFKLEFDDPSFMTFLTGNDACELLTTIEEQEQVRFRIDKNSVIVEGHSRINFENIRNLLLDAWKENDFKRAIEISELTNKSAFQLYFKVSPAEAALMQVNARKLRRCPGLLSFKADSNGNVCLFGKDSSAADVFGMVTEIVSTAAMDDNFRRAGREASFDCPCILTMLLPKKASTSLFAPETHRVTDLQQLYNCFVKEHKETEVRIGVPVSVFTRNFQDALAVKEAICAFVDQQNGLKRKLISDIKLHCSAYAMHFSMDASATSESDFKPVLSADEIRLIFLVNERDAPRIIGAHGITKKRIQECSKCSILLHTESKRDGYFPVEIIGPNIQKCVETRHRIESFLSQTPPAPPGRDQQQHQPHQQWSTSGIDDRTRVLDNSQVSQIPFQQQQFIYASEQMLSPQQSFSKSFVWNSSMSHALQAPRSSGVPLRLVPKIQLPLVSPQTGAADDEDTTNEY